MKARRSRTWWREQVRSWRQSGLSARSYGEREGVSSGSLYQWASKLRREDVEAEEGRPGFRAVRLEVCAEATAEPFAELVLRSGRVLRLRGALSQSHLSALIRLGEELC